MRKLLISAFILCGCASNWVYYKGMVEDDFKNKNKGERVVKITDQYTAYEMVDISGKYLYFYFRDSVLIEVNQGVDKPDVVVEVK